MRNRWFDPGTGTWLSPDPLGYRDSSNLYAFAGGDPVNRQDPLGQEALPQSTPKVPLPPGPPGKVIPFPQPTVPSPRPQVRVGGPIAVGLLIEWTINKGAQFLEEDADNYVEWSRQRVNELKIAAAKRRNGGSVLPKPQTGIDADPDRRGQGMAMGARARAHRHHAA
ncbi:MAG: RHS repeat-associated core domain-containing protein [Thermoanaerobaculia bacterium]